MRSPRFRFCACTGKRPNASLSPLNGLVPTGLTPELEYLQVTWAAYIPYAATISLLAEILPIADSISVSGVKRRVRVVGSARDASDAGSQVKPVDELAPHSKATAVSALAVDSGWLRHCDPPHHQGRHVNSVDAH